MNTALHMMLQAAGTAQSHTITQHQCDKRERYDCWPVRVGLVAGELCSSCLRRVVFSGACTIPAKLAVLSSVSQLQGSARSLAAVQASSEQILPAVSMCTPQLQIMSMLQGSPHSARHRTVP